MTGKDLLTGMGYVDKRFVEEIVSRDVRPKKKPAVAV